MTTYTTHTQQGSAGWKTSYSVASNGYEVVIKVASPDGSYIHPRTVPIHKARTMWKNNASNKPNTCTCG